MRTASGGAQHRDGVRPWDRNPQNVVYPLAELASISFKRPLLSNPEIRLERAARV
jgi:hypothetical protein